MEVSSLQAAAARHGSDESVDTPRHPHPPPQALQTGGRTTKQALHSCALPSHSPGHGTPHGQEE